MAARAWGMPPLQVASGGNINSPTVASAVNFWRIIGSATGSPVQAVVDSASSDTNVTAVVGGPKGTGAIQAQAQDSATTGGNARGTNAVDWQTTRSSAANVASGATSVIAGGTSNTANGQSATVAGGNANNASGQFSWLPGGSRGSAPLYGMGAWGAGRFSTDGDAESFELVMRNSTTDATGTRITADAAAAGSSNTVNLPNNATFMVKILVTAQQTGGGSGTAGDCAGWEMSGLIKRGANAAATTLVGSSGSSVVPTYNDAAAAAWRLGLTADTTNGGLAITATGEASKSIRWVVRVMGVRVTT